MTAISQGTRALLMLLSTSLPAMQRNHVRSYQCPRCRSLFRKEKQFPPHFKKTLAEIGDINHGQAS